MSTFRGFLVDLPLQFLAIDHFEPHTYGCDIFLLSHHHSDHMKGLYSKSFEVMMAQSKNKFVYCSTVTAHFLSRNYKYRGIRDRIKTLDICKPFVIQHESVNTDVVITSLPAGHCPGSVMFLIEYHNKRILYSGDIRITADDLKRIRGGLTNPDNSIISIDDLYLDTTWALTSPFNEIPSREDSENMIIHLIELELNTKVVLNVPSTFGYETLFMSLYRRFRKPVLIHDYHFEYYRSVEEMSDCVVSTNQCTPDEWLVHACGVSRCSVYVDGEVRIIRPCVFGFVKGHFSDFKIHPKFKVPFHDSLKLTRVMYSCHSSLSELREIYTFLKPKRVFPSVKGELTTQEILNILKNCDGESTGLPRELKMKSSTQKRSREEAECRRMEARKKMKV